MAEDTPIRPILLVVKEIQDNTVTTINFEGGKTAKLPKARKDYHDFMELARESLQRKYPVAVQLAEPDTITELVRADCDVVRKFVERDKESMEIQFKGHDGIFFLRRDHPDFKRISDVLNRSIKEKKWVWFVAELQLLFLQDVILFEQKAEAQKDAAK